MQKEHGQVTGIIWKTPEEMAAYQELQQYAKEGISYKGEHAQLGNRRHCLVLLVVLLVHTTKESQQLGLHQAYEGKGGGHHARSVGKHVLHQTDGKAPQQQGPSRRTQRHNQQEIDANHGRGIAADMHMIEYQHLQGQ